MVWMWWVQRTFCGAPRRGATGRCLRPRLCPSSVRSVWPHKCLNKARVRRCWSCQKQVGEGQGMPLSAVCCFEERFFLRSSSYSFKGKPQEIFHL